MMRRTVRCRHPAWPDVGREPSEGSQPTACTRSPKIRARVRAVDFGVESWARSFVAKSAPQDEVQVRHADLAEHATCTRTRRARILTSTYNAFRNWQREREHGGSPRRTVWQVWGGYRFEPPSGFHLKGRNAGVRIVLH